MIHESFPWKLDLRRRLRLIEKYNTAGLLKREDDSAYTILEKCVFYSAFIIRKLTECAKLSDAADRFIFHAIGVRPIKHIGCGLQIG